MVSYGLNCSYFAIGSAAIEVIIIDKVQKTHKKPKYRFILIRLRKPGMPRTPVLQYSDTLPLTFSDKNHHCKESVQFIN